MKHILNKSLAGLALAVVCSLDLYGQNTPNLGQTAPAGTVTEPHTVPPATMGYAPLYNYTRTFIPKVPITDESQVNENSSAADVQISTVYKDGFQRPMLGIQHNAVALNGMIRNLVQPIDTRFQPDVDACSYLPYSSTNGLYEAGAFSLQKSYYDALYPTEQSQAFSKTKMESDANSRKSTSYAPGLSNVGQGRGTTNQWVTNTASQVRIWKLDANGLPVTTAYYNPGTLTGDLTTNTSGAEVTTFTDKSGKLICKTVLLNTVVSDGAVSKVYGTTYYVYDELGQLRYTLPPKATDLVSGGTLSQAVLDNLCFQYIYNAKGLKVKQKVPGKGWEYSVYDKKNRLVYYQDDKMRTQTNPGKWTFTIYDKLDRPLVTGTVTTSETYQQLVDVMEAPYTGYNPSMLPYYTKNYENWKTYPATIGSCDILSYTYYDDYTIVDPNSDLWNTYTGTLQFSEQQSSTGAETPWISLHTRGLVTGSKVRIIPSANANPAKVGDWKQVAVFYDEKGRPFYTVSKDFYQSNIIHESYVGTQYDFSGKVLTTKHIVRNHNSTDGTIEHVELIDNQYDVNMGRLTTVRHKVNTGAWKILTSYSYDDLGRMKQEVLGSSGEVRDYTYNIRGQLTGINGNYAETGNKAGQNRSFGESLKYDYGFSHAKYDGKVTGMIWRGSSATNGYAYGYYYDQGGWLTTADFRKQMMITGGGSVWSNTLMDYSVSALNYDKNGNILSMNQRGMQPGVGVVNMDILTYKYENSEQSNRLQYVNDAGVAPYGAGDFANGNTGTNDYSYDPNGNLSKDLNKGITSVQYNLWNKPDVVTFANGNNWQYSYNATGSKVQERQVTAATTKVTDYLDNFVYQNDSLQYILTPVGRTLPHGKEEYFVKDHLGNVRSTIDVVNYMMQEYLASFEVASANLEGMFFDNLDEVRDLNPSSINTNDQYSARLNGAEQGREIGASLLMKVMTGDHINFNVNNYYEGYDRQQDEPMTVDDMLGVLLNTLTAGNGGWNGSESHNTGMVDKLFTPENYSMLEDMINNTAYDPEQPKAYLNYILFDENMRIVPEMSGAYQANGNGGWASIGSVTAKTIPANGYFAVFLNNKTRIPSCISCGDVYFDQLKVEVGKSNLLEENHYYPFGLPITGLSSQASGFKDNKHKYQSNEYTKEGLNWMDFHNRQYDPQLGRFLSVDPLAANTVRFSPYTGMNNNPVSVVDPLGLQGFQNPASQSATQLMGPIWAVNIRPAEFSGGDAFAALRAFDRESTAWRVQVEQEREQKAAAWNVILGNYNIAVTGSGMIVTNSVAGGVTGSSSANGVAASGDTPDDENKSEKQRVYELKGLRPIVQIGSTECSYTALAMIEELYGGKRTAADFKDLYQDPNNLGLPFTNWERLLEVAGFEYTVYHREGKADPKAWAIVAKGMDQGNASIILDVNPDGSTHAVVGSTISQGMTTGNLTTTVADPWYGMNVTRPENYWHQTHVIFVIKKPQ